MTPKAPWMKAEIPGTWKAWVKGRFLLLASPTGWRISGPGLSSVLDIFDLYRCGSGPELVDNMLAAEAALTEQLELWLTLQG